MMLKERVAVMNHLRSMPLHSPELRIGMLFYYFENTLTQKILKISQKCSHKMDTGPVWARNAYEKRIGNVPKMKKIQKCKSGMCRVKVK